MLSNHQQRFSLFRAGLKDRMNLCLFWLSLVEGMFVFVFSLTGSHCLVRFFRPDLQMWWKWLVHSDVVGFYRGFLLCSGCLTMIISVERCVCVFLPLRATLLIRTRTMAVIVFTTIATIQALCLIYPLKVQTPLLLSGFVPFPSLFLSFHLFELLLQCVWKVVCLYHRLILDQVVKCQSVRSGGCW